MRLRSSLSAVLVLLLLAVSAMAARCDARCGVMALHGACHAAMRQVAAGAGDCMSAKSAAASGTVFAAPAGACQQQVCLQPADSRSALGLPLPDLLAVAPRLLPVSFDLGSVRVVPVRPAAGPPLCLPPRLTTLRV